MDGMTGCEIRSLGFEAFHARFGEPYRVVHRRDLLRALLSAVRNLRSVELLTHHRVEDCHWPGASPVLILGDGKHFPSDAVIGADGVRSPIRTSLGVHGSSVRETQIVFRALVSRITAPHLSNDVVLWLYPRGHVVHYPVSAGREVNIVAMTENHTVSRASNEMSAAEVAAFFPSMAPELRYVLGLSPWWARWEALDRPPAKRWGKGRTTLIGDAAHPMLPTLAQGAVAALEDAITLAECLNPGTDPAAAFRRYESLRQPHVARLQMVARAQARLYHSDGWQRQIRNHLLKHMPERLFFMQIAWIFERRRLALSGF
jgi:salicylate hydroxylase